MGEQPKVKIYTTNSCAYCKMAKGFFKSKDIEYTEIDVSVNQTAREEMVSGTGRMSVPAIKIDENWVSGFDRRKIEGILGLDLETETKI